MGLSFHAGSQAANPQMHVRAIEVCGDLMRRARASGHELSLLDIGGGFPTDYLNGSPPMPIEEFCAPIRSALQALGRRRAHHRRARTLPLGAVRRGGGLGDGTRAARRALVVLPGRRPVRQLQRADVRPREVPDRGAGGRRPHLPVGARRSHLRQHRCDPRAHRSAEARAGRPRGRARDGRLYLGLRLGIQFFPARDRAGSRPRPPHRRGRCSGAVAP